MAKISSNAKTALATNCEVVEDSQYYRVGHWQIYNTGKLEHLAVGEHSDSISHSLSFKDTFRRQNNEN